MRRERHQRTWEVLSVPDGFDGKRILSHERGNPDTEVGRSLHKDNQVGETKDQVGTPTTSETSDQLIVLRDGSADHKGKGLTGIRSLQRKH
jgi:hypothetical protein